MTTDAEYREMIVQLMKGDRRMDWTVWPTANPLTNSIIEPDTHEGSFAVTCPIPGGNRIKETIIVTQAGKFTEQARIFVDLYANENAWLNWALDKLGKPLLEELVRLPE